MSQDRGFGKSVIIGKQKSPETRTFFVIQIEITAHPEDGGAVRKWLSA